jgi:hypothetical protein
MNQVWSDIHTKPSELKTEIVLMVCLGKAVAHRWGAVIDECGTMEK